MSVFLQILKKDGYPSFVILVRELILNSLKPLLEGHFVDFTEEQFQLKSSIKYASRNLYYSSTSGFDIEKVF